MQRFNSLDEAQAFIGEVVDKPTSNSTEFIRPGISLTKSSIDIGDNKFTNSYDLAFNGDNLQTEIVAFDTLTSTHDFISNTNLGQYIAATSGGFFYLADKTSGVPRQLALNLSISRGNLRSLPVADRESVIAGHHSLEVRSLVALGSLSINGHELDWSGSLTDYDTELKVYSNGNVVIKHQQDTTTGNTRVLYEDSRYTPVIGGDDMIDIGFIGRGANNFIGVKGSTAGGVDIFAHDFVLRCPQRYVEGNSELEIHTIGGIALSRFKGGAFSAGPALNISNFHNHSINQDLSLGSHPPFLDMRLARTVLYKAENGLTHIRLFDGRPGSHIFPGLTPTEAASHIMSEGEVEWGCFLDPGQTAKLCINGAQRLESYGNRHYVRWPDDTTPDFLWVPEIGRPVANVIAL
jgi:hypothetical protein